MRLRISSVRFSPAVRARTGMMCGRPAACSPAIRVSALGYPATVAGWKRFSFSTSFSFRSSMESALTREASHGCSRASLAVKTSPQ